MQVLKLYFIEATSTSSNNNKLQKQKHEYSNYSSYLENAFVVLNKLAESVNTLQLGNRFLTYSSIN